MVIPLLNAMLPKIILLVKWFILVKHYWTVLNLLFGTNVGALDAIAEGTKMPQTLRTNSPMQRTGGKAAMVRWHHSTN